MQRAGKDILLLLLSSVLVSSETAQRKPREDEEKKEAESSKKTDNRLNHKWTFYFDDKSHKDKPKTAMNKTDYLREITKAGTCDTLNSFEDCWNDVLQRCRLSNDCNYHLFKEEIKPLWEDPKNVKGGKCVAITSSSEPGEQTLQRWVKLMQAVISGEFEDRDVTGVVLSVRPWGNSFAVWTRDSKDKQANEAITRKLREIFGKDAEFKYQRHQTILRKMQDKRRGSTEEDSEHESSEEEHAEDRNKRRQSNDSSRGKHSLAVDEPIPVRTDIKSTPPMPRNVPKEEEHEPRKLENAGLTTLGKVTLGVIFFSLCSAALTIVNM